MAPRDRSRRSSPVATIVIALFVLPILYLLPFVAVFLDEIVFHTYFFSSSMPGWFEAAFEMIYWPILETFFR